MFAFQKPLGDCVKKGRAAAHLSQSKIANIIDVDKRTIMKMEHYEGNPKLVILYPLVRLLHNDPWEIFYPELTRQNQAIRKFQVFLTECSEQEIDALIPVCREVIHAMRSTNGKAIEPDT